MRLTVDEYRQIAQMLESGMDCAAIAREIGSVKDTVWHLASRAGIKRHNRKDAVRLMDDYIANLNSKYAGVTRRRLTNREAKSVAEQIAERHQVKAAAILNGDMGRRVQAARRDFYITLRQMGHSFQDIGFAANRDHSTVVIIYNKYASQKHAAE